MKLLSIMLFSALLSMPLSSTKIEKGEIAPEIIFENTNGFETKLSSLRGNIVLIDFWASWCGPCRRKHPELVSVYNQFKDVEFEKAGRFEIFSVSLDKNKDAWLTAIEKDKLKWENHVSDLKAWNSEVVKLYGIKSIPHNVLIDSKGAIIASDVHGEQLKEILSFTPNDN